MAAPSKGQQTRARLLAAARELLVEQGGDLAFADVAVRAGISAGAPYRYFSSKAQLVVAVVEDVFDQMEAAFYVPAFDEDARSWWDHEQIRIERLVDFFFDVPIARVVMRSIAGDAEVTQARARRVDKQTRGAAKNIARGCDSGDIPKAVDPLRSAALVMGGIYHLLATVADMSPAPERRAVKEDLKRFVRSVLQLQEQTNESTH